MKKAGEWSWFCPVLCVHLIVEVPVIWLLELHRLGSLRHAAHVAGSVTTNATDFMEVNPTWSTISMTEQDFSSVVNTTESVATAKSTVTVNGDDIPGLNGIVHMIIVEVGSLVLISFTVYWCAVVISYVLISCIICQYGIFLCHQRHEFLLVQLQVSQFRLLEH